MKNPKIQKKFPSILKIHENVENENTFGKLALHTINFRITRIH